MRSYVEERALTGRHFAQLSQMQLADINSLSAQLAVTPGQGGPESPAAGVEAATIQESSVMAFTPPNDEYIGTLGSKRSQIIEYVVQEGDLLSFIASDFGVSVNSILWANNLRNADAIRPGQTLRIPPVTGVVHIVKSGDTIAGLAQKYDVPADKILAFNQLPQDGSLTLGDELVIPDGVLRSGTTASSGKVLQGVPSYGPGAYTAAGSAQTAKRFSYLPDFSDFFKIPAIGFNWGILHGRNGVDIANSCGTAIYASAAGTITTADASGWNGGFGKYVKISHANGTETLYGHLSKILVSVGKSVAQGEKIALMGTTGRSTGCHVHFEVHGARNPLVKY